MKSPFPGMDPFLERPERWPDVHFRLIAALSDALQASLRPRYLVRAVERVYLSEEEELRTVGPDVTIVDRGEEVQPARGTDGERARPVLVPTLMAVEEREHFLEVRLADSGEVVTVIEVLSPGNKRGPASDGRRLYLEKRRQVLRSEVHLVEIDLLRTGNRVPMAGALPEAPYYVIVSDARRRPTCEVYPIGLREALPTFALPLRSPERTDVPLQAIFEVAYDRGAYDLEIDYEQPAKPPLSDDDAAWARLGIASWRQETA